MTLGTHYLRYDAERDQLSTSFGVQTISGATHPSSFHAHPAPSSSGRGTKVLLFFVWHVGEYVRLQIESGMSGSMHFASKQFAKHFSGTLPASSLPSIFLAFPGHITAGKTCC